MLSKRQYAVLKTISKHEIPFTKKGMLKLDSLVANGQFTLRELQENKLVETAKETLFDLSEAVPLIVSPKGLAIMQDYKDKQVNVWFERGFFFLSGLTVGIFSGIGTTLVMHFFLQ